MFFSPGVFLGSPWRSSVPINRVKVYRLTLQEQRNKTNLKTWSHKTWRVSMERLKFCFLNSSFFTLAEVIALRRFGGTEHPELPGLLRVKVWLPDLKVLFLPPLSV